MAATAHLLSSHATFFDPSTVLSTLPPHWPLLTLSLYLVRALRTTAHTAHERTLIKALATGQNLIMLDGSHSQLRAAGALVEEAADEDDMGVDHGAGGGEELVLDEKTALESAAPVSAALDLGVSSPLTLSGKTERAGGDAAAVVGSFMSGQSSVTNTSASVGISNEDTDDR
jgi:Vacuolar sorting protein 39 domain 2